MKEKEDKLKLMKQILISDDEIDTKNKLECKETIQIQNEIEIPTTSKIITTTPSTISEATLSTTTPKIMTKAVSTVKFDDYNNRLSRKVNIIITISHNIYL